MRRRECRCSTCRGSCHTTPGWFRPGEVAVAASAMGLDVDTFARTWGVVDFMDTAPDVLVLAPARIDDVAAGRMLGNEGPAFETCALLGPNGCRLPLEARPYECAMLTHAKKPTPYRRLWMLREWRDQTWVRALAALTRLSPPASP